MPSAMVLLVFGLYWSIIGLTLNSQLTYPISSLAVFAAGREPKSIQILVYGASSRDEIKEMEDAGATMATVRLPSPCLAYSVACHVASCCVPAPPSSERYCRFAGERATCRLPRCQMETC